jgi:hypothetical protein
MKEMIQYFKELEKILEYHNFPFSASYRPATPKKWQCKFVFKKLSKRDQKK